MDAIEMINIIRFSTKASYEQIEEVISLLRMWEGLKNGNYLITRFENNSTLYKNYTPQEYEQKYLKEIKP